VEALRDEPTPRATIAALAPAPVAEPAAVPPSPVARRSTPRWLLAAAVVLAFALGALISQREPSTPSPAPAPAAAPSEPPFSIAAVEQEGAGRAAVGSARPEPAEEPLLEAGSAEESPVAPAPLPGLVAFESAMMSVSSRAIVAAVPVRHFANSRRQVDVGWRVLDGARRRARRSAPSTASS
jgi:hypothetical protein